MTTFVNPTEPYLRILNPATGDYARFIGGKLELDEDDPDYAIVMAEAQRRPTISIHTSVISCPECGEPFAGKAGKAQLGKHRKEIHFDAWLRDQEAANAAVIQQEIKSREGFSCDQCAPVQTFPTTNDLAVHVRLIHEQPPALDEDGNEVGGGHRPGEVDTAIPAAAPSGG